MTASAPTKAGGAALGHAEHLGVAESPAPHSTNLRARLMTLDGLALAGAWLAAELLLHPARQPLVVTAGVAVVFAGLGVFIFGVLGLYRARVCSLRAIEHTKLARSCLLLALLGLASIPLLGGALTAAEVALGATLSLVLSAVARGGFRNWVAGRRRAGSFLRTVLLVGCGEESVQIGDLLECHPELGYRPIGVLSDPETARRYRQRWCGELDDVALALSNTGATGAIVCATALEPSVLNRVVNDLLDAHAHVQLSSGLRGVDIQRFRPLPLAREPMFYIEPVTLARWQLVLKRTLDLVGASVALLLTSPALALAALAIKLEDRGPVLFRQVRVGRHGEHFVVYKLRTMRLNAEAELARLRSLNVREGPLLKIPDDPRVSRVGRVLRATSVDELPQLWNVLNGSMSLVGPRPALPDEEANFDDELRAREAVRPGITGLWQIEGRDNPSFAAYRRFDLFYLRNWSIGLDLMIMFTTVESLVARTVRLVVSRHRAEIEPTTERRSITVDDGPDGPVAGDVRHLPGPGRTRTRDAHRSFEPA